MILVSIPHRYAENEAGRAGYLRRAGVSIPHRYAENGAKE